MNRTGLRNSGPSYTKEWYSPNSPHRVGGRRQPVDEVAVERDPDPVTAQHGGVDDDGHRPQAGAEEPLDALSGAQSPQRFQNLDAQGTELRLLLLQHPGGTEVPEGEGVDALTPQLHGRRVHRLGVAVEADAAQRHGLQRDADAGGLVLQQRDRESVHGRRGARGVHRGDQPLHDHVVLGEQHAEGQRRVLAP